MDLRELYDIDEVLYSSYLDDDYKLKKMEQLFGEQITPENVEYLFKKWRNNNVSSSNVKNILYDDETLQLTIQFKDKSIYTYYNVDFDTYRNISTGNAAPVTTGQNKYGSWKKGVKPSIGAGVHQYLINKGVSYQRGGTLK